jgi:hypothetical protein
MENTTMTDPTPDQRPHLLHLDLNEKWGPTWRLECPYSATEVEDVPGRPCNLLEGEGDWKPIPGCFAAQYIDEAGEWDNALRIEAHDPPLPMLVGIDITGSRDDAYIEAIVPWIEAPTVPVPGPDTPTWTVDDDLTEQVAETIRTTFGHPPITDTPGAVIGERWIRAARAVLSIDAVHQRCQAKLDARGADLGRFTQSTVAHIKRLERERNEAIAAARAHERCGPATDILRQARQLVARLKDPAISALQWGDLEDALLDLLVDGGEDD